MRRRLERLFKMNPGHPMNGTFFAAIGIVVVFFSIALASVLIWANQKCTCEDRQVNQEVRK